MKKIILPICLVVLVAVGIFVLAETSEGEYNPAGIDGSVTLEKGWNLVTIYGINREIFYDIGSEADEKSVNDFGIKAIYFYDRDNKEYVRLHPNQESNKVNNLQSRLNWQGNTEKRKEYAFFTNSAVWIYSEKKQTFNFQTLDGPFFINYFNLKQGWNFLYVTPEMIGKNLNDIKGNCNIQKSHAWWAERQEWDLIDLNDAPFPEDSVGYGIILKVSNDCKLGTSSGSSTNPPGLPGDVTNANFPPVISGYSGENLEFNNNELCDYIDSTGEEICQTALNSLFYSNIQESNEIIFFKITKGDDDFKSFMKQFCNDSFWDCDSVDNVFVDGKSYSTKKLIYWYYETDKYISIKQWGSNPLSLNSPVFKYFLNKYPPISV